MRKEFLESSYQWRKAGFSKTITEAEVKLAMNLMRLAVKDLLKEMFGGIVQYITQFFFDPVDGSIVDTEGWVIGYKNGTYVKEIPGGIVLWMDNNLDVFLILGETEKGNYSYQIQKSEGRYNIAFVAAYLEGGVVFFNATEIPIQENSVHSYQIDWDVLKAGANGTAIRIDQDGDGTAEAILKVGSVLPADLVAPPTAVTVFISDITENRNGLRTLIPFSPDTRSSSRQQEAFLAHPSQI